MGIINFIFGGASLISLLFALYTHFKSKGHIYALIEKLRASRNNFLQIERIAKRIVVIAELKGKEANEKVVIMRQLARSVEEATGNRLNVIDDGKDWGNLSVKEIYKTLIK